MVAQSVLNTGIGLIKGRANPRSPAVPGSWAHQHAVIGIKLRVASVVGSCRRGTIPVVCSAQAEGSASALDSVGAGERKVRVHYFRKDRNFDGWGLHVSGDPAIETQWSAPLKPCRDPGSSWVHWDLELQESGRHVELIVHKGEDKSVTCRLSEWQLYDNEAVWLVAGESNTAHFKQPNVDSVAAGDLTKSYAHWVAPGVLAWRQDEADGRSFRLHWSASAGLTIGGDGLHGEDGSVALEVDPAGLPQTVTRKFPHLTGCTALRLPATLAGKVDGGGAGGVDDAGGLDTRQLLRQQLAVSMSAEGGEALDATGVQLAGVLDDLYTYDGPLGCNVSPSGVLCISLWAPTAQDVTLLLYDGPRGRAADEREMQRSDDGVWRFEEPDASSTANKYYKYRLRVYCPWTQRVETSEATDPYSRSLAANGERTQVLCDMSAADLKPQGWDEHVAPPLASPTDISVYELHVRDFSCHDDTVPEQRHRGGYLAFTHTQSAGMMYLTGLAAAGLTHVHLLPSYDFGSVPERQTEQLVPEGDLSVFPSDSEAQQAAVLAVADRDAFNWGYDPVHYGVPEGSYSTDPDGPARITEYRSMVQALHGVGLRVVLDVVYNHTYQSGPQGPFSVLDKVVPGYYHRREENGDMCMSTCCNNTASEHAMCERLVVDDVVHWTRNYKVDGFRFDIMGHMMCSTMDKIRKALDGLTLEVDGVDGKSVYLYGEAWDFGEVAFNQRGRNASQLNLAGSGIGSFNDRMRDAAMGGGPFAPSKAQGVVTGLETDPNTYTQGEMTPQQQLEVLLEQTDLLRLGLAGNLREYRLATRTGEVKRGVDIMYCGSIPAAYAKQPQEVVNYVSCHDNQTLFDQVMMKAPKSADVGQRTRMCMLANALVVLGQGVPFLHAGDELLRSKSLDRDSYNSGDWFNRLDWSGTTNNFGVGLPVATKNEYNWPIMRPLLADQSMKPSPELIRLSSDYLLELLSVRYSSPLFRLPTSDAVCAQLSFPSNTGPQQVPGGTVMQIVSADLLGSGGDISGGVSDPRFKRLMVVFNASIAEFADSLPEGCASLQLHPLQKGSCDECTRSSKVDLERRVFVVPPRTTAVFVEPR